MTTKKAAKTTISRFNNMHHFGPLHVRSSEPIPSESVVINDPGRSGFSEQAGCRFIETLPEILWLSYS